MAELNFGKATFTASYGLASQIPASTLPEFVFVGRSNVGKSSLINKLCNRKNLARVSSSPGKTATINFYTVGDACLVDLPGYGYAKTSQGERRRWDSLINGYFERNRNIRKLLLLLDTRRELSRDDLQMLDYLKRRKISFAAVTTKYDKLNVKDRLNNLQLIHAVTSTYGSNNIFATSSEKNIGIDELQQYMQTVFGGNVLDGL